MRRPRPRKTISRSDHEWSGYYGELIKQYEQTPPDWNVAMTAIRLFIRRLQETYPTKNGFDILLAILKQVGVPMVASKCREELVKREEFFDRMLQLYPPDDLSEVDVAKAEIATDLVTLDTVNGGLRLLSVLDRLLQRESVLSLGNHKVQH